MYKSILFVLLSLSTAFAQSAGNDGMAFLKLGFGGRNIAMGNIGAEVSNDVTSLYYNPARLSGQNTNEILLMHNAWIQGTRSEVLGAMTTFWGLPVALGFNVTSVSDIPVRTYASAEPLSTFNANYFSGSISTGFNVYDNISFGFSIKYLYEGLYMDEATGWAFDFGLSYNSPVKGLSFSGVINNLGSMNKLKNEKTKLPAEFNIGPAYNFSLDNNKLSITAGAGLQKYTLENNSHFNLGFEVIYNHLVALRGGYQSGYEAKSFTGGFGLIWGNFGLDYAFQPFTNGLGSANIFSIRIKF
jgi:hypothetical protein